MRKILLTLLLLFSFDTLCLNAKSYRWEHGDTFLSFLRKHKIPLKLYYNLDSDDKELLAEIRAGQKYSITKQKKKTIIEIPVTDELQVKITKKGKKANIVLEPIPFEVLEASVHLKVKGNPFKDLYKKTHSKDLVKALKEAYSSLNLNKMRRGDTITIFYQQKRRKKKAISSPKILASLITIKGKKYYSYLADDGRYYDSLGKEYRVVTKKYSPYLRPVKHYRISSGFTYKRYHPILHRYKAHLGIDYASPYGTPIRAIADGKIVRRGYRGGYGKCITIQHSRKLKSLYAHMSKFRKGLKVGQRIKKGTIIGYVGSTGRSTGPHLHLGIYKNGKAVNPARYIRTKTKHYVKTLKGKEYRKLRRKVIAYRAKFRKIMRKGDNPIYVRNGIYLYIKGDGKDS